jgi:hypothetical protein
VSNFTGNATFLNMHINDRIAIGGNKSQTSLLGLGILSEGSTFVATDGSTGGDIRTLNCRIVQDPDTVFPRSGSKAGINSGVPDSVFITSMIEATRDVHSEVLTSLPDRITDVRMYRIWSYTGSKGIELNGADTTLPGNTDLSDLLVSAGCISPSPFSPVVTSYRDTIPHKVSSVTIIAKSSDNNAQISINDVEVNSGTSSAPVPLAVGDNRVVIQVTAPDGAVKIYTITITRSAAVTFGGKVFLQGAYDTLSGAMSNILNSSGILQAKASNQPYNTLFEYNGAESVGSGFFAIHPDIVDWIVVELRSVVSPTSVISSKAGFVTTNGTIVDTSGDRTSVLFDDILPGYFYVSVRHRNHLAVRSAVPVDLTNGIGSYDFTTGAGKSYQNQSYTSTVQVGTIWAMRGGNANSNNTTKYNGPTNDQDRILNTKLGGSLSAVLSAQYASEDINMDGLVKANGPDNDQNFLLNIILSGSVGTVLMEQL